MDNTRFETNDGKPVIILPRESVSYFYKFDLLQGIISNPDQVHVAKKDSCYLPASQLVQRNSK